MMQSPAEASVKITLNMAGAAFTITFLGETGQLARFYGFLFREFISDVQKTDALLKVSFVSEPFYGFPLNTREENPVRERALPSRIAADRLSKEFRQKEDFPFSDRTISTLWLNGILLYCPDSMAGRIYISKDDPLPFGSLYYLSWLYFAQVLGERGGCFLHAAALVKDGKACLFLGESGAGKSTIAGSCRGCEIFSDESPIICGRRRGCLVYPSPFHQLDHLAGLDKDIIEIGASVTGFYFLIKDNAVFLDAVSKKEAFSLILGRSIHFFHFLSRQARTRLFDLFFMACDDIPAYFLHTRKGQDIWDVLIQNN
jgi:hypothetical protein